MIRKATVRKARMTGYQKKNRKLKGNIFLKKEWIGKRVMIMPIQEFRDIQKKLKFKLTRLRHIERLSK